jgi:O-antigen ligase
MPETVMKSPRRLLFLALVPLAVAVLFEMVERSPGLFADATLLGGILVLQVCFLALRNFEKLVFPLLVGTFFWAGIMLPYSAEAMSLRWLFLGLGALAGLIVWIHKSQTHYFGAFHLVALFCVISAFISAAVSEIPATALLKASSLCLLFLYGSAGARVAIVGREKQFIFGLILASELLIYASALCYFVLDVSIFGNPNSLGAVVAIIAMPILLWGVSIAETRGVRHRRVVALLLCGGLLCLSSSRASILSAAVVIFVFAVALRRHRRLLQVAFASVLFFAFMAVVNPSHANELFSSVVGKVLYKEPHAGQGIFESRISPWAGTLSAVRHHPWFGSGFGTSEMGDLRTDSPRSSIYTIEGTNREHGSSYLALAEYLGLLGSVPFVFLVLMLVPMIFKVWRLMRRTASACHYSIPLALVVIAGLVHAGFEDWLFAVGSYLSVFFWIVAFMLIDVLPVQQAAHSMKGANSSVHVPAQQALLAQLPR